MAKVGRPSDFTQEVADKICAKLAEGESMRMIATLDEFPSCETMFRWIRTNTEFREQYARAKQESADFMADEILDISDDGTNDWEEREIAGGRTIIALNSEAVQRSKLRVETRKWLMAKMKPKKYGEKLDLTSDGEKLPTPILHVLHNNSNPEASETK